MSRGIDAPLLYLEVAILQTCRTAMQCHCLLVHKGARCKQRFIMVALPCCVAALLCRCCALCAAAAAGGAGGGGR